MNKIGKLILSMLLISCISMILSVIPSKLTSLKTYKIIKEQVLMTKELREGERIK